MDIRELHLIVAESHPPSGTPVAPPALKVAACAVLHNPHQGSASTAILDECAAESARIGEILVQKCLQAMGERKPIAFGKGVLVGEAGDLEQGAAMIHCRIGLAMRSAIRAGYALIPGNAKRGGPGASLDVVLGGIDDGWHYDAMDTLEVRIPGAPRADEIVLAVAFGTGRPNARIVGASEATVRALVDRMRGAG
ncbi:MAG TPA: amino acid synthesis family protein [Ottowia sp.]|uniref:amino acid synthesis family protein n=1 Tax=Ottowia sp. TaxID=1898956 RepID=UPI002BDAB3E4|nr:amino acid synthesis family protein [Ottowia sp.]HMN20185.1 amino acid synthesis family protein [Ottowia sp.]